MHSQNTPNTFFTIFKLSIHTDIYEYLSEGRNSYLCKCYAWLFAMMCNMASPLVFTILAVVSTLQMCGVYDYGKTTQTLIVFRFVQYTSLLMHLAYGYLINCVYEKRKHKYEMELFLKNRRVVN